MLLCSTLSPNQKVLLCTTYGVSVYGISTMFVSDVMQIMLVTGPAALVCSPLCYHPRYPRHTLLQPARCLHLYLGHGGSLDPVSVWPGRGEAGEGKMQVSH